LAAVSSAVSRASFPRWIAGESIGLLAASRWPSPSRAASVHYVFGGIRRRHLASLAWAPSTTPCRAGPWVSSRRSRRSSGRAARRHRPPRRGAPRARRGVGIRRRPGRRRPHLAARNASTTDERRLRRVDLSQLPLIVAGGVGLRPCSCVFLSRATDAGSTWWPLVVVRPGRCGLHRRCACRASRATKRAASRHPRRTSFSDCPRSVPARCHAASRGLFLLTGVGDLVATPFLVLASRVRTCCRSRSCSPSLYPVGPRFSPQSSCTSDFGPCRCRRLAASLAWPLLR